MRFLDVCFCDVSKSHTNTRERGEKRERKKGKHKKEKKRQETLSLWVKITKMPTKIKNVANALNSY